MKEAAMVLAAAAGEIEAKGWCQRMLTGPDGSMCLVGAIIAARPLVQKAEGRPHYEASDRAYIRLADALGADNSTVIAPWNDKPRRRQDEVIKLLLTCSLVELMES